MSTSTEKTYRPETRLVHAGTLRSQFGETSEALFSPKAMSTRAPRNARRAFPARNRATFIRATPTRR